MPVCFTVKPSKKGAGTDAQAPPPSEPVVASPNRALSLVPPELLAAAVAATPLSADFVSSAVPVLVAVGCGAGVSPARLRQAVETLRSAYGRGGDPAAACADSVAAALVKAFASFLPESVPSGLQEHVLFVLRTSTAVSGGGRLQPAGTGSSHCGVRAHSKP